MVRELTTQLIAVLQQHGYEEHEFPLWFAWDDLRQLLPGRDGQSTLKLIDGRGGVMALRSDFTAAVALGWEGAKKAQKLSYAGPVYRADQGQCIAYEQVGCESLGSSSLDEDVALLKVAAECLKNIGVEQPTVVVNSVAVLRGVTAQFGPLVQSELLALAQQRSIAGLQDALSSLGPSGRELASLMLRAESPASLSYLVPADYQKDYERLQAVFDVLRNSGIRVCFELTLVRELDYYTGLVFEFYAPGVPYALGGGGRYDRLIRGGSDEYIPAAGFALQVKALSRARSTAKTSLAYELSGHH